MDYYPPPPPPPQGVDTTNVLLLLMLLVFLCMVALAVGLAQMGRIERTVDTLVHLQYALQVQQHPPWWEHPQW
jgi:hypothetical protein